MKAIMERRSIRKYTDQNIPWNDIETLLKAAMSAPSSGNQQPWHFIVIDDRATMVEIAEIDPYAQMLRKAPCAIAVCGDLHLEVHKGFWVQDCSAATENILIAAQDMGLGSCWIGIHSRSARVIEIQRVLKCPANIVPFSIVSLGYPGEEKPIADRYKKDRIHINTWRNQDMD